jgi:hypothetical protein
MGWTSIQNGDLLALAAQHFDVFVTADRNLSFQQHLPSFSLAVVVLSAKSNRLAELRLLLPDLLAAIETAPPGVATLIGGSAGRERLPRVLPIPPAGHPER